MEQHFNEIVFLLGAAVIGTVLLTLQAQKLGRDIRDLWQARKRRHAPRCQPRMKV